MMAILKPMFQLGGNVITFLVGLW